MVLAVNAWDEDKAEIRRFVKKNKLEHRILLDGKEVRARYGAPFIPTTLWINRDGVVVDAEVGFDGAGPLLRKTKKLLAGSG